jgi:hypothetical protein
MNTPDFLNGVRDNIRRYAAIGVDVHFSEVDIRCQSNGGPHCVNGWVWNDANLKK